MATVVEALPALVNDETKIINITFNTFNYHYLIIFIISIKRQRKTSLFFSKRNSVLKIFLYKKKTKLNYYLERWPVG